MVGSGLGISVAGCLESDKAIICVCMCVCMRVWATVSVVNLLAIKRSNAASHRTWERTGREEEKRGEGVDVRSEWEMR